MTNYTAKEYLDVNEHIQKFCDIAPGSGAYFVSSPCYIIDSITTCVNAILGFTAEQRRRVRAKSYILILGRQLSTSIGDQGMIVSSWFACSDQ